MVKRKLPKQRTWTNSEVRRLKSLAKQNISAPRVARALHRSLDSTKKKASRLSIALGTAKRPWTAAELRQLKALAKKRRPLPSIAKSLGRTVFATEKVASIHHVSLDFRK
jgi:serine/threonine-protein kinase RIO1